MDQSHFMMGMAGNQMMSDSMDMHSQSQSSLNQSYYIEKKRRDILLLYEDINKVSQQSILSGGIDTGIDSGKFVIDTSSITGGSQAQDIFADRFIGPYARNQLNSPSWLSTSSDDDGQSSSNQKSNQLMQQYFKLINSQMHGLPGGKVESESFSHDFRLPDCYDI